jgi:hypothetical protein
MPASRLGPIVFVTFVLVMLSEELVIFRGRPKLVPSIGGREKYERETEPHDLCRKIGPSFCRSLGYYLSRISSHSANEVFADRIEISRSTRTA